MTQDSGRGPRKGAFDLHDLGVLDGPPERSTDMIVELASEMISAPVSLLTIIDDTADRQFFKAQVGLMEPFASQRETPLAESFCRFVRARSEALLITHVAQHPEYSDHPAQTSIKAQAYLGVPIYGPANDPIGALCVIDHEPRNWSARDLRVVQSFAQLASEHVLLRAALETIKIIKRPPPDPARL